MKSLAFLSLITFSPLLGAQTIVDWYELADSDLNNDLGTASGTVDLTIREGLAFPGFPSASLLGQESWSTAPSFADQAGSSNVPAIDIKVAPLGGNADFEINLTWETSSPMFLLLGQFYGDLDGVTSPVSLLPAGSSSSITFIESLAWSNGLDEFLAPLNWDPINGSLSKSSNEAGDSQLALFRVSGADGITITVPNGYPSGTGDELTLAIGQVIPEPSTPLLLGGCVLFALNSRQRKTRAKTIHHSTN